jgi:CHAT domain-containing protein
MFISNADSKKYCSEAYDLYQTLIYPFENDINNKKITVIADGILNYIPFDALLRELPDTTEQIQFNRLSYLTRKNIINYGYSANLLFNDYYRLKKNGKTKMLAFAPEYNNESITFQDDVYTLKKLQGTKREVELISRYVDSKIFIGSNATESNFRKNYKSYDILHLAMHAFINDSLPAFSCFAFSQNHNKEQENDGWLTIGDIYNLDMKARLTVLSACNTGSGKLKKGEGFISLARGFIYAGCPSIIMTLWEAEDNAGTKIMHSFYKNLKKGKATDVAMNLAKIEYLENANPHMAHPHYWIGYVSIGNHIPLFRSYDFYFFIILTFSFIGIMADQLIKMKKQKNQP